MVDDAPRLPASYGRGAGASSQIAPAYDPAGFFRPPGEDMAGMLRKLWRRKWLILTCSLLMTAAAATAAVLLPQRYTAEAQLRVGLPEARLANIESVLSGPAMDASARSAERRVGKEWVSTVRVGWAPVL